METLSFPRLSPAEIVTHVQNSILTGADGKSLSKNDIFPNPKPEVVRKIFLRTLQIVYGIPLDLFSMMPVNIEVMYPQIMEGYLPLCNLFTYIQSFLRICRVNDFEFADILYPKGKRTCRFLSAIINFIHFRESRREIYMKHLWEYKSSMDKMQQLQVAQQEALVKLEKLDSVPAEEQAEFKQLLDDIQELQQTLNGFHQKTVTIQEGISQKKLDLAETTKRLNELKLSLVTLKEEQESLKTKIVDSPEKLKNDKEKMKETVQKLKTSKLEVTEKYEAYRDAIEGMPSFQMELQLYQKKMQELAESMDKVTRILKENQSLEDQIESAQTELKKLKTEETSLKRLVIVEKEKLATTQLKINKKHEDVKQYKRLVLEECNKLQEKRGAICEQVTAINCDVQKIKREIQQLKDVTESEKLKFQEIFLTLKSAVEKYHEAMEKVAEEGKARISETAAELKKEFIV